MKNTIKCPECGENMSLRQIDKKFKFMDKTLEIHGLNEYLCDHCGFELFDDKEVKMIESLFRATSNKPDLDVLSLKETADLLRVSNQTIYNMIKDGRLKARKVGREWRFIRADIQAFLNDPSDDILLAAKGGQIDRDDYKIISEELETHKKGES